MTCLVFMSIASGPIRCEIRDLKNRNEASLRFTGRQGVRGNCSFKAHKGCKTWSGHVSWWHLQLGQQAAAVITGGTQVLAHLKQDLVHKFVTPWSMELQCYVAAYIAALYYSMHRRIVSHMHRSIVPQCTSQHYIEPLYSSTCCSAMVRISQRKSQHTLQCISRHHRISELIQTVRTLRHLQGSSR